MKRDVLVEAGHRCALPGCGNTTIEIAHIKPWAQVRAHAFDNLIALCANCHVRFDRGDIDRLAMLQYKANLGVLNNRYGEVERRVLNFFAMNPAAGDVQLPGGMDLMLMYLLHDEYLVHGETYRGRATADGFYEFDVAMLQVYRLTEMGREFVTRWSTAGSIT